MGDTDELRDAISNESDIDRPTPDTISQTKSQDTFVRVLADIEMALIKNNKEKAYEIISRTKKELAKDSKPN